MDGYNVQNIFTATGSLLWPRMADAPLKLILLDGVNYVPGMMRWIKVRPRDTAAVEERRRRMKNPDKLLFHLILRLLSILLLIHLGSDHSAGHRIPNRAAD